MFDFLLKFDDFFILVLCIFLFFYFAYLSSDDFYEEIFDYDYEKEGDI